MEKKKKGRALKDFLKDKYVYTITLGLAFLMMLGAWLVGEIGPFGGRCLVVVDGVHQYLPFFSEYQHKLQSLETLQYTTSVGLGNNFLSLWSYYLSSPLNLIIMLCTKQHLPMALNIIITVKIILAAVCFAYFLMHTGKNPKKSPGIIAFSLFYAFSSYVIGYYWNLMWLDCIFIFPIIILGMEKMLEKKDSRMYILALLYSFICNYYISFMICIFLTLWFFTGSFRGIRDFFGKGLRFAAASLTTAAMGAVVLIPAYLGIMTTASAELDFPKWRFYGSFADTLRSHLFCSEVMTNQVTDAGTNLYCGIFVLMLAMMFFFIGKKRGEKKAPISIWKKLTYALLLVLFVVSFNNELLNYIWHGFHNQYGIPNRFAFLYVFVLLLMAYQVYCNRDRIRLPMIVVSYVVGMVFVIFCYYHAKVTYDKKIYIVTALVLSAYLLLFLLHRELPRGKRVVEYVILVLAVFEVAVNGMFAFNEVGSSDPDYYYGDTKTFETLKTRIEEAEDSYCRSDVLNPLMVDEATWYNLRSVGIFGSTVRGELVSIMGDLGFYTGANEYLYYGATPVTNALLGVKYVYTRDGDFVNLDMDLYDSEEHISVYRNRYALPIGYMVNDKILDYDTDSNGPFTVQNELCGALAGIEPIFTTIYDDMKTDVYGTNVEVQLIDENNARFSKANSSARADMTFTIPHDMDLYVNSRGTNINKIALLIDGKEVAYDRYQGQLFRVGKVKEGQLVDIQFALNDDKDKSGELYCYPMEFNPDQFQRFYNVLANRAMQVTNYSARKIEGTISVSEDGVFMTSLPYDEGWHVYVDDEEEETYPVLEGFLAADLTKGEHTLRFVYRCPGLQKGFVLTLLGVVIFFVICGLERKSRGKPEKMGKEGEDSDVWKDRVKKNREVMRMRKNEGTVSAKVIYLILLVVLILAMIIGDIIVFGKLEATGADVGIKTMLSVITVIIIALTLAAGFFVFRFMEDDESGTSSMGDKYKTLFMNLPIGFARAHILRDSQTGRNQGYRITDANATFGKLFALEPADYQNITLSQSNNQVLHDINAWFEAYNNSGTKIGELMAVEITMEKFEKVFNTVMYKSESDYINMVVIDITEQKETENKLSTAIKDAEIAYKTQAEFLANMSHEIRTPINGILGMLQLTLVADDLQADYRDNLTTAKNSADALLRLINDILDISKLEAGKYNLRDENFDIKEVIEETVAAQVPLAKSKGLTLDCNFGNEMPQLVRGDGERIQQVLNCLLSNAIKFTSEGGVRVKVAVLDDIMDKIKLRIAVADSGIGISDADKNKLFIRFSQVDASDTRKYGGSGLGLVITKQIVELMGGEITVQSKEGLGSTFIVEVPLKLIKPAEDGSIPVEAEDPAVFSVVGHTRARILVAEDEPVNQQVIGKLLGMAGYSYDIAENGEKAVELFKKKEYDAALFDVQMPVMDGLAATQEIREIEQREKKKRLPIIAVTARAMFGDKERILEARLDDYIAKPYNLNDVVEILNKYVDNEAFHTVPEEKVYKA